MPKARLKTGLFVDEYCVRETMLVPEGEMMIIEHAGVRHEIPAGNRKDFYPSGPGFTLWYYPGYDQAIQAGLCASVA